MAVVTRRLGNLCIPKSERLFPIRPLERVELIKNLAGVIQLAEIDVRLEKVISHLQAVWGLAIALA